MAKTILLLILLALTLTILSAFLLHPKKDSSLINFGNITGSGYGKNPPFITLPYSKYAGGVGGEMFVGNPDSKTTYVIVDMKSGHIIKDRIVTKEEYDSLTGN